MNSRAFLELTPTEPSPRAQSPQQVILSYINIISFFTVFRRKCLLKIWILTLFRIYWRHVYWKHVYFTIFIYSGLYWRCTECEYLLYLGYTGDMFTSLSLFRIILETCLLKVWTLTSLSLLSVIYLVSFQLRRWALRANIYFVFVCNFWKSSYSMYSFPGSSYKMFFSD